MLQVPPKAGENKYFIHMWELIKLNAKLCGVHHSITADVLELEGSQFEAHLSHEFQGHHISLLFYDL